MICTLCTFAMVAQHAASSWRDDVDVYERSSQGEEKVCLCIETGPLLHAFWRHEECLSSASRILGQYRSVSAVSHHSGSSNIVQLCCPCEVLCGNPLKSNAVTAMHIHRERICSRQTLPKSTQWGALQHCQVMTLGVTWLLVLSAHAGLLCDTV